MKHIRLLFVTALAVILLKEEVRIEYIEEYYHKDVVESIDEVKIPGIPEYKFFSFLDQVTGTWKEEYK